MQQSTDTVADTIGRNIRRHREGDCRSLRDLAERCEGVDHATIQRVESGAARGRNPSLRVLVAIANGLTIPVVDLFVTDPPD